MRRWMMVLAVATFLVAAGVAYAGTTVVESISGSAGDWTYTYVLTNGESSPIYNWAVWFPSDPDADTVTALTPDWSGTHLPTQGFFPKDLLDAGYTVKDSDGNTLAGPNGEPGLFQTYADDFKSNNPLEYWDGDSWEPVPDPVDPPSIWDAKWRGKYAGWDGLGADILTSDGIAATGGTGQFSVHSSAAGAVTGQKSFSFSTIDYWYSIYDGLGTPDMGDDVVYFDFEGSGTVTPVPEPGALSLVGLGLVGLVRRKRRS